MSERIEIDAEKLSEVRLSADGTRVNLIVLNPLGQKISLSLPADCLNAVIDAMPRRADPGVVHRLDSWSMNAADNGADLVLTLRTPEAVAISFALKPWQVEGMATIAAYGSQHRTQPKTVH